MDNSTLKVLLQEYEQKRIKANLIAEQNKSLFEITNNEFTKFKNDILQNFNGSKKKIEFKSKAMRNNLYMMMDNSGNIWIPSSITNNSTRDKRKLLGNIKIKNDWESILLFWQNNNEFLEEGYGA